MNRKNVILLLLLAACTSKRPAADHVHVAAANVFTRDYSRSRLAGWNVRGTAAGRDCDVLLVETSIILEDSMVEALHYGAGAYAVVPGGVERFTTDRAFRGVAYKDASGKIWTFGRVTAAEAESLQRCD